MKLLIRHLIKLVTLSGVLICGTASAQTYFATVETDQVKSSTGTFVNFGGVIDSQTLNLFHGVVSASTDLDALFDPLVAAGDLAGIISAFSTITWTPMVDATVISGLEWWSTPNQPIQVGERPVVAFMNASGPGALTFGSEIGLVQSVEINSAFDNPVTGFISGQPYTVIVGDAGSIQLTEITAVPEPAEFALLFGALGLGFVMWRRRR